MGNIPISCFTYNTYNMEEGKEVMYTCMYLSDIHIHLVVHLHIYIYVPNSIHVCMYEIKCIPYLYCI